MLVDDGVTMQVRITSGWGDRIHPITHERKHHNGIDIGIPQGTPVVAVAPGRVIKSVGDHPTSGGHVILEHDGGRYRTGYCHLSQVVAPVGSTLQVGDLIGYSGGTPGTYGAGLSTGAHLHFILWMRQPDGKYKDVDPQPSIDWTGLVQSANS